jgi:TfoX/Sxy family transcriptional regulator of competence genes
MEVLMAYDEGLAERIRDQLLNHSGIVEKKMFGGVGFILNGNMACGVNKEDLIVRVGPNNYEASVTRPHTRPFDFTGRPMKGWVMVSAEGYETDDALVAWVNQGVEFALSLPPK